MTENASDLHSHTQLRQRCHRAFALSSLETVEALYAQHAQDWTWQFLRKPEIGLLMARGRIGGGGAPFNLGEVSVTRASVSLPSGEIGHALVQGRSEKKAAITAVFDAGIQSQDHHDDILNKVVLPLELAIENQADVKKREAAATKVDFFTMVRGDN